MKPSLQFYIDVSGQPKEDVFVGMISIQTHDIMKITSAIKKKFPWFFHKRKKGSSLNPNEIDSIISLLNGLGVRMVCTHLKSKNWNELIDYCGKNKANNYEKIFAALYFQTLKKYSKENNSYPLTVCVETFMNIDKVISNLIKISLANNFSYQISKTQVVFNEMLKITDIIAAAGRKDKNAYKKYNFFSFFPAEIDSLKYYLKKLK